jgi:hypothetical protein
MRISAAVVIVATLAGGGLGLAETKSIYVSPFTYANYDCAQLAREARALSSRSAILAGVQQSPNTTAASDNNGAVVIPWPSAFSLVGDKNIADKLALMRGQMLAIEDASVQSQCSIQFQRPPA